MCRYSIVRKGTTVICNELPPTESSNAMIKISQYVPKALHPVIIWNRVMPAPSYNSPCDTELKVQNCGNGYGFIRRHISSGNLASFTFFYGNKYFKNELRTTKELAYAFNGSARKDTDKLCENLSMLHEPPLELK
jgi:hypothetical protein